MHVFSSVISELIEATQVLPRGSFAKSRGIIINNFRESDRVEFTKLNLN